MIPAYVDLILLRKFAELRVRLHANHASSRPLSEDYEYIGMVGEAAFAKEFRMPMDLTVRQQGDKGIDFQTRIGSVDVKTARKATYLAIEVGRVIADIYVLARYDETLRRANLIGWEWGRVMKECATKDFGYGIQNHVKPAGSLRTIFDLRVLMLGEAK